MANFFSALGSMFGLSDKEEPQAYNYTGVKPFKSLKEIPETQDWLDELKARIAGRNVGFSPEVLGSNTAPYAKQRMATLNESEIPLIKAQASAVGMGKSTIPVNRVALSGQAAARDIEERVAQLTLENERQKRSEINQALTDFGGYPIKEAATREGAANFDKGVYDTGYGYQSRYEADRINSQMEGLKRLVTLASTAAGAVIGGPTSAMIGSNIMGGGDGGTDLASQLLLLQKYSQGGTGANVNIAGKTGKPGAGVYDPAQFASWES